MTPAIRRFFSTISHISPQLAGRLALLLFSTPLPTGRLSPAERRLEQRAKARLASAERLTVAASAGTVVAYKLGKRAAGTGRTILLVHGWMSGARYMLALAEELVAAGDEVICFDLPAHGESSGRVTNLAKCAQALLAVAAQCGPVNMIVAHSFGGAVTAYATSVLGLKLTGDDARIILLASPNRLAVVTQRFGAAIGLSDSARRTYEQRLVAPIGGDLDALDGNRLYAATGLPLFVIHCEDDAEVAFSEGERFAEMGEQARVTRLNNLGHRRILYAQSALDALRQARSFSV